nr:MAG TPA: hypothetical protein [Bacteriophage sp.]
MIDNYEDKQKALSDYLTKYKRGNPHLSSEPVEVAVQTCKSILNSAYEVNGTVDDYKKAISLRLKTYCGEDLDLDKLWNKSKFDRIYAETLNDCMNLI